MSGLGADCARWLARGEWTISHERSVGHSRPRERASSVARASALVSRNHCGGNVALLGNKRAESVHAIFKIYGVSDGQIEVVSFGEDRPKSDGKNETAWAENRRVDIDYR